MCTICGTFSNDDKKYVVWFGASDYTVHKKCYDKINPTEKDLLKVINICSQENSKRNLAHLTAIESIEKKIAPASISAYYELNGTEKTTRLFNKFGIPTVLDFFESKNSKS